MKVYFLRPVGRDGPVKIGTSCEPRARLAAYQHWSPEPLELVAEIDGGHLVEQRFHAFFARDWLHHEWFAASPAMSATINAIRAGAFDLSALPRGARLTHQQWRVSRSRHNAAAQAEAEREAAHLTQEAA